MKKKIFNMNFNELRDELVYCDNNPIKEMLIRKLMKEKYVYYIKRKQRIENEKRLYNLIQQKEQQKQFIKQDNMSMSSEDIYFEENDFNFLPDHGPLNELDKNNTINDRLKNEIDRDHFNNNLMERMNSEIDIIKLNNKRPKDAILKPYEISTKGPFDNNNNVNKFTNYFT